MKNLSSLCILAVLAIHNVAGAQHPLEPLDTSSPRATLSQFLEAVDRIGRAAVAYCNGPSRESLIEMAKSLQGELPFSNLDSERIQSLTDTLEWPPPGSKKDDAGADGHSSRRSHPVNSREQ